MVNGVNSLGGWFVKDTCDSENFRMYYSSLNPRFFSAIPSLLSLSLSFSLNSLCLSRHQILSFLKISTSPFTRVSTRDVLVGRWILTGYRNINSFDTRRDEAEANIELNLVRYPVKIHRLTDLRYMPHELCNPTNFQPWHNIEISLGFMGAIQSALFSLLTEIIRLLI